jgi:predicted dehydrogenase
VEKPVSTDPVVLNQLIELCSSQVRVGYNRRFYSSVNEIKRELTNESGIIQVVIPELSTTIGTNSNQRVNAVLENSVHMFDLLYFLFGDISIRQTASISENVNADSLMIQAQFGERFVGNIILLFENPENYSLNCWVRRKNLELKPIETLHKSIKINLLMESERLPYKRYKKNIVEWKMNEDDLIAKPGFLGMYREFIEFIHSKSSVNLATLNDALNAVNFGITLLATSYKKNDNN